MCLAKYFLYALNFIEQYLDIEIWSRWKVFKAFKKRM